MVGLLTWIIALYPVGFFLILLVRWRREVVEFNEQHSEHITFWRTFLDQTYRVRTEEARAALWRLIRKRNRFMLLWWGVFFLAFLVFALVVTLRGT